LFPSIGLNYRSQLQTKKGSLAVNYTSALVFADVIEYIESNGVPGYQPGADTIVRVISLFNANRNGQSTWSQISLTQTTIPSTTTNVYTMSFNLQKGNNDAASVYFGLNVAVKEVAIPINGTSSSMMILVPSGVKFTFDATGITYQNPNSTGLAFGVYHLSTGGAIATKTGNSTSVPAQYRPDQTNPDQTVFSHMDPTDNVEGSLFSFRSKFRVWLNNQFQDHAVQVNGPTTITNPIGIPSQFIVNRFYFSTTQQVSAINWDPNLSASEDSISSSSKTFLSLTLCLLITLFLF